MRNLLALALLAGCQSPTACNLSQIDVEAYYFNGSLLAMPHVDVTEPYCEVVSEEPYGDYGVTRRVYTCAVCLDPSPTSDTPVRRPAHV